MKLSSHLFAIFFVLIFQSVADARLLISVTVPSQAWLINQIAGDRVDILTMIPDGHVPETAQPGPQKMALLMQSDIHFLIGHPSLLYEVRYRRSEDISQNNQYWVNLYALTAKWQPDRLLKDSDPHLWTSPTAMLLAVDKLAVTMSMLDPENADIYNTNKQKLVLKIRKLDSKIKNLLAKTQRRTFLVYHPAWGHFSYDYGLSQVAIEGEGKAPGPGRLARLLDSLNESNTKFIISSPGAEQRLAGIIAAQLQAEVLLVNPLRRDWLRMMNEMLFALERIFEVSP